MAFPVLDLQGADCLPSTGMSGCKEHTEPGVPKPRPVGRSSPLLFYFSTGTQLRLAVSPLPGAASAHNRRASYVEHRHYGAQAQTPQRLALRRKSLLTCVTGSCKPDPGPAGRAGRRPSSSQFQATWLPRQAAVRDTNPLPFPSVHERGHSVADMCPGTPGVPDNRSQIEYASA